MRVLIVSDRRVGHENQSKAFCELLGYKYDVIHVNYLSKTFKVLSYILDNMNLHVKIFTCKKRLKDIYDFIVSCGSSTYYPALYFGKKHHLHVIALMYPSGYKNKNFFHIFAGIHDNPPLNKNITILPVNITNVQKQGFFTPKKEAVGIIVGGDNLVFTMESEYLLQVVSQIKKKYEQCDIAITTSPRTPKKVEENLKKIDFDFSVFYTQDKKNPIGDFVFTCKEIFITEDSTSMISSCVSFGKANVHIIPLSSSKRNNKYRAFSQNLVENGYANFYGEEVIQTKKYNLMKILQKVYI